MKVLFLDMKKLNSSLKTTFDEVQARAVLRAMQVSMTTQELVKWLLMDRTEWIKK